MRMDNHHSPNKIQDRIERRYQLLKNYAIFTQDDLMQLFPFGKTKLNELLKAGVLPVVKVGRQYITNEKEMDAWFHEYRGLEVHY